MPISQAAALKLAQKVLDPLNEGISELTVGLAAAIIVRAVAEDEKSRAQAGIYIERW